MEPDAIIDELCIVQINQECFPFACPRTELTNILPGYGFVHVWSNPTDPVTTSRNVNIAHVYTTSRARFGVGGDILSCNDNRALMVTFGGNSIRTEWISNCVNHGSGERFRIGSGGCTACDKFWIIGNAFDIRKCSVHPC